MDQLTELLLKAREAQRLTQEVREAWIRFYGPQITTTGERDMLDTAVHFMRPEDLVRMIVHAMNLECEQLAEAEITEFGEEHALSRFKRQ